MLDAPLIPKCINCGKEPDEIPEYVDAAMEYMATPAEYVRREEGTYNPKSGHFYCTDCYIDVGMPLGVAP